MSATIIQRGGSVKQEVLALKQRVGRAVFEQLKEEITETDLYWLKAGNHWVRMPEETRNKFMNAGVAGAMAWLGDDE
jgi:hypothetical protein